MRTIDTISAADWLCHYADPVANLKYHGLTLDASSAQVASLAAQCHRDAAALCWEIEGDMEVAIRNLIERARPLIEASNEQDRQRRERERILRGIDARRGAE